MEDNIMELNNTHTKTVKNSRDLFLTLQKANEANSHIQTIILEPGKYFADEDNIVLSVKKNLTIKGKYSNAKATHLNCGFLLGDNNTLILKNLAIDYDGEECNTIALYDGAELYGDNIIVDRTTESRWDTIFCKDSTLSLKNSEVLTDPTRNICGISLKNSQIIATHSNLNAPLLDNSTAYLKDVFTNYAFALKNKSNLSFTDLTLDTSQNTEFSDFYVDNHSTVTGINLNLPKKYSYIDVINSHFENTNFASGLDNVRWRFDKNSTVLADGDEPFNNLA